MFISAAGFELVSGVGSCGCFGEFNVNPLYTALFDGIVVLILPFCRPHSLPKPSPLPQLLLRRFVIGVITIVTAAFGVWDLMRYSSSRLKQDGLIFIGQTVVLNNLARLRATVTTESAMSYIEKRELLSNDGFVKNSTKKGVSYVQDGRSCSRSSQARAAQVAAENVRQGFGDALPDHFALG
jgi:hypothetical protein